MGGFTTLANIGTGDKALADFFIKRIQMIDRELERLLRDELNTEAVKLFKRSKPAVEDAGKKPKDKFGPEVHKLFKTLQEATEWTEAETHGRVTGLWQEINSGELTVEEEEFRTPWTGDNPKRRRLIPLLGFEFRTPWTGGNPKRDDRLVAAARLAEDFYAVKLTVFERMDGTMLYDTRREKVKLASSVVQAPKGASTTTASFTVPLRSLAEAVNQLLSAAPCRKPDPRPAGAGGGARPSGRSEFRTPWTSERKNLRDALPPRHLPVAEA